MPKLGEFERLGGLFENATDRSRDFLDRCSETKFMAVKDYSRAEDEYITLAKRVLETPSKRRMAGKKCKRQFAAVRSALESGQLGPEYISALQELRQSFFNGVLKPTVRAYLAKDALKEDVESLYESAICIEGLLEVIHFLEKIQRT
jgi:hypothetical protein